MGSNEGRVEITIGFSDLTDARANVCAGELARWLRDEVDDAVVERARASADTQDLGTVLTVLVSSAAAVQIARGVREWLRREASGTILDWSSTGLVAKGLTSADMVKVVEHLTRAPASPRPDEPRPDEPPAR